MVSANDMAPEAQVIRYDGIHCNLLLEQLAPRVVVLRISGTDVGEFAEAPMKALNDWIVRSGPIDFFIDARQVRGASMEVSGEWAAWLNTNKEVLRSVTMLTGSRYIQITADFVRRYAGMQEIMRICTESAVFDSILSEALSANAG